MAYSKDQIVQHLFQGGWATDLGTIGHVGIDQSGRSPLPFLLRAENIFYQQNGAIRKFGGTSKYNSSAVASGAAIRGMFEFVRSGTAGSPTRKRVVHAGSGVYADDNDGSFSLIFSSSSSTDVPNYTVFEDQLIVATDRSSGAPYTWDQTTYAALGGSPPDFAFSVAHVNRLWAAGDPANPSRLYYSELLDSAVWNGTGTSGVIDVEPDDGDIITGIYAHRGVLFVFKGPNFGSIHVISGRTPSTFARDLFVRGIGAIGQNLIFPFGNDLGFVAQDATIRSLATTDKFGDFEQSALSLSINTWLRDNVNLQSAKKGWAVADESRSYALISLPIESSTVPNTVIGMDYRVNPVRLFRLTAFDAYSIARMSNPSDQDKPILYFGGSDGFLRKANQSARSIDGSAGYAAYAQSPFLHYGEPHRARTIHHLGLGTNVVGTATIDVSIRTDMSQTSFGFALASTGAVLGPATSNEFTLDTSELASDDYRTVWAEVVESGQSRSVSYEISNDGDDEDFEIDALYVGYEAERAPNYEN